MLRICSQWARAEVHRNQFDQWFFSLWRFFPKGPRRIQFEPWSPGPLDWIQNDGPYARLRKPEVEILDDMPGWHEEAQPISFRSENGGSRKCPCFNAHEVLGHCCLQLAYLILRSPLRRPLKFRETRMQFVGWCSERQANSPIDTLVHFGSSR